MSRSTNKLARIFSTIFVPPSFTILIFTFFAINLEVLPERKYTTIVTAFTFGFGFIIMLFLYLRKRQMIGDEDATVKDERTFPYMVSVLFYMMGFYVLVKSQVNPITLSFWICYITNTIIVVLINKFWKISAHSIGAAGALAAMTIYLGYDALYLSPIVILVGWSRIKLRCHDISQVAAGILFGFFSTYLQMNYYLSLLSKPTF